MTLQDTFYIVGIIFMGLMLIILIALATAVFVIRNKIVHMHKVIDEKVSTVTGGLRAVTTAAKAARQAASRRR